MQKGDNSMLHKIVFTFFTVVFMLASADSLHKYLKDKDLVDLIFLIINILIATYDICLVTI